MPAGQCNDFGAPTPSERIGLCTRMRRFLVRFIRSELFVHTRSSAGFTITITITITTSRFKFSVHTGRERSQMGPSAAFRYWTSAERKPFLFRKRDQAKKLAECCSGTVVRRFRMPE